MSRNSVVNVTVVLSVIAALIAYAIYAIGSQPVNFRGAYADVMIAHAYLWIFGLMFFSLPIIGMYTLHADDQKMQEIYRGGVADQAPDQAPATTAHEMRMRELARAHEMRMRDLARANDQRMRDLALSHEMRMRDLARAHEMRTRGNGGAK